MLDPNDPDDGTSEWIDREMERADQRMEETRPGAIVGLILATITIILYLIFK